MFSVNLGQFNKIEKKSINNWFKYSIQFKSPEFHKNFERKLVSSYNRKKKYIYKKNGNDQKNILYFFFNKFKCLVLDKLFLYLIFIFF